MNPVELRPIQTFEPAVSLEPTMEVVSSFRLKLSFSEQVIGWLGQDSGQWGIIVTDPAQAVILELYPYNGVNYYRIKGTSRYMSVNIDGYIGFYNWLGATGFTLDSIYLRSDYNGFYLSFKSMDNGYVYAMEDNNFHYKVLIVTMDYV